MMLAACRDPAQQATLISRISFHTHGLGSRVSGRDREGLTRGRKLAMGIVVLTSLIIGGILVSFPAHPAWHQVGGAIQGYTGIQDSPTSTFVIRGSQFRVHWNYTADSQFADLAIFSFFVYPGGETSAAVANVDQRGTDKGGTEYVYSGPGAFYIRVIVANVASWSISIEDFY